MRVEHLVDPQRRDFTEHASIFGPSICTDANPSLLLAEIRGALGNCTIFARRKSNSFSSSPILCLFSSTQPAEVLRCPDCQIPCSCLGLIL